MYKISIEIPDNTFTFLEHSQNLNTQNNHPSGTLPKPLFKSGTVTIDRTRIPTRCKQDQVNGTQQEKSCCLHRYLKYIFKVSVVFENPFGVFFLLSLARAIAKASTFLASIYRKKLNFEGAGIEKKKDAVNNLNQCQSVRACLFCASHVRKLQQLKDADKDVMRASKILLSLMTHRQDLPKFLAKILY